MDLLRPAITPEPRRLYTESTVQQKRETGIFIAKAEWGRPCSGSPFKQLLKSKPTTSIAPVRRRSHNRAAIGRMAAHWQRLRLMAGRRVRRNAIILQRPAQGNAGISKISGAPKYARAHGIVSMTGFPERCVLEHSGAGIPERKSGASQRQHLNYMEQRGLLLEGTIGWRISSQSRTPSLPLSGR